MKRSKIWYIPEDKLRAIVAGASSYSEILQGIGVSSGSSSRGILKQRIAMLKIDTSHILHAKRRRQRTPPTSRIPLNEILVEHSTYKRSHLKRRLLENNLIEYQCAICGQGPEWEGKELVLDLDHINGVKTDHRLENLRFLCPNCHSQTETFAGKNARKKRRGKTHANKTNP